MELSTGTCVVGGLANAALQEDEEDGEDVGAIWWNVEDLLRRGEVA